MRDPHKHHTAGRELAFRRGSAPAPVPRRSDAHADITACRAILEGLGQGQRMTQADAEQLLATPAILNEVGRDAGAWAREHTGDIITYCVDTNISYTNVCDVYCRFCAFWRTPGAPDAYVLTPARLRHKVSTAVAAGATQILLQGGHNPALGIEWYEAMLQDLKGAFPSLQLHALSPSEIHHIRQVSGCSLRETLSRLHAAGLDSLPGGGAEVLSDEVRDHQSIRKMSADQWLEVHKVAHQEGLRSTATMMFGTVDLPRHRTEHLQRLRTLQDQTGGFTAFICWTYQQGPTVMEGNGATGVDYLLTSAVARLFLDNIANLQASWPTQGPAMGQVALWYGANDFGSTLLEENVVSAAGALHRMDEAAIVRAIQGAGFIAAKRTTLYDILHVHPSPTEPLLGSKA